MKYEPHPIAGIFPMMSGQALETLEADIKANGLQSSGLLYEGKILDGRNRYAVCCKLGIEMNWQEVELGEPEEIAAFDPVQYVLSHNLHRRHLKPSQRAMIGAKIATLANGQHGKASPIGGASTREDTAALLGIGTTSIDRAKVVLDQGSEELIEAVEQCSVSVSAAHELCHQCPDKQEQSKLVKEGRKAIAEFLRPERVATPEGKSQTLQDALRSAARCKSVAPNYFAERTGLPERTIKAALQLSDQMTGYKAVKLDDGDYAIHRVRIKTDAQQLREAKSIKIEGDATPVEHLRETLDTLANTIEGIVSQYGPNCKGHSVWKSLSADDCDNLRFLLQSAQAKVSDKFPMFLEYLPSKGGQ